MLRPVRGQAVAVLLLLLTVHSGYAQPSLGVPTSPVPAEPTATEPAPPAPVALAAPAAPMPVAPPPKCPQQWHLDPFALYASAYPAGSGCGPAGPPPCIPYEDNNGPLLVGDPLLDNPPATPGWIGALELAGVVPHRQDVLKNSVTLSNGVTIPEVALPNAPLGAQVMPTIVLGYRFGQATGDITVSYRVVAGAGSEFVAPGVIPNFAPSGGSLRSRLNFQVLDIDYGSYEPSLGPQWDMKWRVGVRGTMQYADNQADGLFIYQQTTNRYWGIGPHGALDLRRWIGDTGLALYGRADMSFPIGRTAQRYIDDIPGAAGESRLFQNDQVLSLNMQFGVAWSPHRCDNFRIITGYTWEHWWDVGSVGVAEPFPRQQLNIQGGFVRLEWNY